MKINFWTELSNRWSKTSPVFFKKFQAFGAWCTATGGALIGVPAALNATVETTIDLSVMLRIASYLVLAGLVISAMSKLPVKDPDYTTLDKKE